MKRAVLGFCVLLAYSVFPAGAGEKENSTAYVSVSTAVEKTGEQSRILKALEKARDQIQKLVRQKSEKWNKEAEKIRKEMSLLSDNEKMKKYNELQKMQLSMEQFVKTKELELQKKEADLRKQFMVRLRSVTADLAKKEKLSVVRNKDQVLWASPKMDLTDRAVKAYKKKYKK